MHDHFSIGKAGVGRANTKGGKGYDNKRGRKCEAQVEECDFANE